MDFKEDTMTLHATLPEKTSPQKLITHPNKGSPKIETERVAGAELKIFDL